MALRNVPAVEQPGELVALQLPASYPNYQRYRAHGDVFSSTMAYIAPVPYAVSLNGLTERRWGQLVTPSYFSTLGVRPAMGRFFNDADDATPLVVSYRFWQEQLAGDPARDRQDLPREFAARDCGRRGAEGFSGRVAPAVRGGSVDAALGGRAGGAGTRGQCARAPRSSHLPHGGTTAAGCHDRARGGRTRCGCAADGTGKRRPGERAEGSARAVGARGKAAAAHEAGSAVLHFVLHGDVRADHADCLRECRQHDAGAGGGAAEGNRDPAGAGGKPRCASCAN